VSRRRKSPSGRPERAEAGGRRPAESERGAAARGAAARGGEPRPQTAPGRRPPRISFLAQVGILVAVFAIVSLIAELAGAANLGVALGIGQVCFAIVLLALIVKT
jgi:hypothetical protein